MSPTCVHAATCMQTSRAFRAGMAARSLWPCKKKTTFKCTPSDPAPSAGGLHQQLGEGCAVGGPSSCSGRSSSSSRAAARLVSCAARAGTHAS
eukprot:6502862-Prymnesium_polylepis.2